MCCLSQVFHIVNGSSVFVDTNISDFLQQDCSKIVNADNIDAVNKMIEQWVNCSPFGLRLLISSFAAGCHYTVISVDDSR